MSIKFEYLSDANLVIDRVYSSNGSANASGDVLSKLMHVAAFGGFSPLRLSAAHQSCQLQFLIHHLIYQDN